MKKFLSLVLALVMTMSLVTVSAGAKDFTDDSKINYDEAVSVISAVKVVDGYTDGSFNPQATLTRGAAAKIICNLILGPTTASALTANVAPYKDVAANHTFAGYIAYCQQQGIISGYADGTFRPSATLTGYAFMKMLLGALGYDAEVEGYVGDNWSIAVAKRALNIGLKDGLEGDFVGTKPVTREEACLYAFNALQADMVEYDTTIQIGDVTVAGSKAEPVANNAKVEGIKNDNKMQFAEKYFSDLKKVATVDAFDRPATTWKVKTTNIGTYVSDADLTYTEEVKLGTIYADLGLGKGLSNNVVEFHVNGATEAASGNENSNSTALTALGLVKGDISNKIGGNGVLTEVFYDTDAETVVITMINTYAGEVKGVHNATASRDAYISISPATAGVGTAGAYETDEAFKIDDVVTYNYSVKAGEGVKNVAKAESIEGELTAYTANKNVTLGGTVYVANKAYAAQVASLNGAIGFDAQVYVDQYGYMVLLDNSKSSNNYAVVLAADTNSIDGDRVKLLFTDATTKVVDLKDGHASVGVFDDDATGLTVGDIVAYSVDADGKYTLTLKADALATTTGTTIVTKGSAAVASSNKAANLYASSNRNEINTYTGKTTFLVKDTNGDFAAYTGIDNVPTVKIGGTAGTYAIYAKTVDSSTPATGAATVVYIDANVAGASVDSASKDVIFVKGSNVGQSYTAEKGNYYVYDAIVNGEITTIEVDAASQTTSDTLYNTVSYNSKGIAHLTNGVNASTDTIGTTTDGLKFSNGANDGTKAEANGVIGLFGSYYSYADDCQVFYKDTDGNMSVWSINSIADDANDKVFAKFVDGEVSTLIIQDVDDGAPSTPGVSNTYAVSMGKNAGTSSTLELTVNSTDSSDTAAFTAKVYMYTLASGKENAVEANTVSGDLTTGAATVTALAGTNNTQVYYAVVTMANGDVLETNTVIGG